MRPDQIIILLILAAAIVLLAIVALRRTGHARSRSWMILALLLVVAVGVVAMLWPMFGFSS